MTSDESITVSVIVPVYNTEQYLDKCLNSLVMQTLENIEIIVINDGSTDGSSQIINNYKEKYPERFHVIEQKNSGQAVARNRGITACHGSYIGFLDSDDYMERNTLELMYNKISSSKADMVYCNFWLEIDGTKERKNVKHHKNQRDLFIDCQVDPWNKLYKADILKNHMVKFPEGFFYEDTAWFIETIPWIHKAVKLNEPLIYHLERKGSSMTALDDKRVSHIFPVMDELIDYYKKQNLFETFRNELEFFYTKILLCSSLIRIGRVADSAEASRLIQQTFYNIKTLFPDYKKNPYWKKHKLKMYVLLVSPWNAKAVLLLTRLIRKLRKKEYMYGVCTTDKN